ncbi:MAG: glycosyltransferase family 39 protein [Chloroflexota bacterium]
MIKSSKTRQYLIILGLTLLAFFLRTYRLDFQSYWIDEAWTAYYGNQTVGDIWERLKTVEVTPPFYYPTVVYWVSLFGDSEFGLRFYSLIFGVVAVPLSYRLGKDLGDIRLGLILALLMSIAPYQIWHSQNARMYAALSGVAILSMWGFINWWRIGGWRWWLVYVIGTIWAIMIHYHGTVLIGIQGLFLLLTWRQHWRGYLAWGGTLLLIFFSFLPWLISLSTLLQDYITWLTQPTLWEIYTRSAITYSLNELVSPQEALWPTLLFVATYGLGLIYATRRSWGQWRGSDMLAFLLAFTLAPNLAAWVYGEIRMPVYLERYLIFVQVGYLLTVSMGILAFIEGWRTKRIPLLGSRIGGALLLLALVGISGWALNNYYHNPTYARPDWRGVADTVEAFEMPGDAILLTGDGGELAFNYYYDGELPVYDTFNVFIYDVQARVEGEAALEALDEMTQAHGRLWFTPYGVPLDPSLEGWLAENSHPAWHRWIGRKRLALYDNQQKLAREEAINHSFVNSTGQGPTLIRLSIPDIPIAAGDSLPMHLSWQTDGELSEDYQLSLRLVNPQGDLFAQGDWPPLSAAAGPTSTWPAQEVINDRRSLWLPADIPPNEYLLQLVVYNPTTGESLGQPAIIPEIVVAPAEITPPADALSLPNATDQSLGDQLTLVGHVASEQLQPGQEMWLWLYFRAEKAVSPDTRIQLNLTNDTETISNEFLLSDQIGGTESWQPGQIRRSVYHLPTSARLQGDEADLKLKLTGSNEQASSEVTLGAVSLLTRPRQFEQPAIAYKTEISFGTPSPLITLIGYDLPHNIVQPGEQISPTFYWQAEQEMGINYTVFVQVLDSAEQVVAQTDLQPLGGAAPTTTWLSGEILTDSYSLTLPDQITAGQYRLIAGFYDATTGQRLPIKEGEAGFVELATIQVE